MNILKKFIAGLAFAAAILAQSSVPADTSPVKSTLNNSAIEAYVRHLLLWPAGVEVTLSDPVPSPLTGFFAVTVRGSLGARAQEEVFYVSADSQTIIRGKIYGVSKNPFQDDLDLLKTDNQPALGTSGAAVSVVEFGDFQCPYCKQESGIVRNQLMAAFPADVQLIYMDFPLEAIHPFAMTAAVLGRCIYMQNNTSFWAYHDWIFQHQSEITADNVSGKVLEYAATDKDLDVSRLTACAAAPEPRAAIARSLAIGNALHINATPTLFINGRKMVGTVSLADLKMIVEQEMAYAKSQKNDCCAVQLSLPGSQH